MYAPPGVSGSISWRSLATAGPSSQFPSLARGELRETSSIARSVRSETPSSSFSAMLPVKPSMTTTSAAPSVTCVPSMFPTNFNPEPALPDSCVVHGDQLGSALRRFLAVGEQRHARRGDPQHGLRERRTHVGELDQMLRSTCDVRPHVEQQHGRCRGHG